MKKDDAFIFHPLTKERWPDLQALFGDKGAYGGCWCMYWRLSRSTFTKNKNAGNRAAMAKLLDEGAVPGILAYKNGAPVGWCAVAPRSELDSLNRSHVLKAIDSHPVWSITCFYAAKGHRNTGLTERLIRAAVRHAEAQGATIVEAYPHAPTDSRLAPVSSYMGFPATFERVGFTRCKEASKAKWIMRYLVGHDAAPEHTE